MRRYLCIFGSDTGYLYTNEGTLRARTPGASGFAVELDRQKYAIDDLILAPLADGQSLDLRLGPYHAIFNAIADPDLNPITLSMVGQICRASALPVLNDPASVVQCTRDNIYRLAPADTPLLAPKTVRIEREALKDDSDLIANANLSFPVLCRPVGSHGGRQLRKHDEAESLIAHINDEAVEQAGFKPVFYITEFTDFRSEDGQYRKYRFYYVGGRVYPWHIMGDDTWEVRGHRKDKPETDVPYLVDEEVEMLADFEGYIGKESVAALTRLLDKTGLDYCGIDCSLLPDNRLILFEANPNMFLPRRPADDNPRKGIYMSAYTPIMDALHNLIENVGTDR